MTRGKIIGKIIDDLSVLKHKVEMYNKNQLNGFSVICEDFFCELLNLIYKINLKNLNLERPNHPGIDLGCKHSKRAFQITATNTSNKINDTLQTIINKKLNNSYKEFKVLIVGKKQSSYGKIDNLSAKTLKFDKATDILDLDDILKEIISLKSIQLDAIFDLFKRDFRRVIIELEPVDQNGDFESSYFNSIEPLYNLPPKNAEKLIDYFNEDSFDESNEVNFTSILDLYKALAKIPRINRELIAIISERGKYRKFNHSYEEWGILPLSLERFLKIDTNELNRELTILLDANLVYIAEEYIEEQYTTYIALNGATLNTIINWIQSNEYSLKTLLNTMDWAIMDN